MDALPFTLNSRSQSPHESATNSSSSPPNSIQQQHLGPQPYLALPTNPIIIIPYSLIRGASVLPGPMLVPKFRSNHPTYCHYYQYTNAGHRSLR